MMANQSPMTLWQTIDALISDIPFSTSKLEERLPARFTEATQPIHSEVNQFLEGSAVQLTDGVVISNLDLRVRRQGSHPGFLVLELQGRCVAFSEVSHHYPELTLTEVPRGRSLDEATSYTAVLPWGGLSFGFRERNPDCLAFVVFNPS